MVTQVFFKAPSIKMNNLENLWFQLSMVSCNLKCKHCYLNCTQTIKKKNFLHLDKVKSAMEEVKNKKIKSIYLNGGEPLLHPDFNTIVRMGLKKTNVTILTNGTLINEKKARFLRQIEDAHDNEIIFRVSLDHFLEDKNDEFRGRGVFKKVMNGLGNLIRYDFNPIITCVNIKNEDEEYLKEGFIKLFERFNYKADELNIKIIPYAKIGEYAKYYAPYLEDEIVNQEKLEKSNWSKFDCANSRVITCNGVYSCPILVGDPRGKVGNSISDCENKVCLESGACYTCLEHNDRMLNNNFD